MRRRGAPHRSGPFPCSPRKEKVVPKMSVSGHNRVGRTLIDYLRVGSQFCLPGIRGNAGFR